MSSVIAAVFLVPDKVRFPAELLLQSVPPPPRPIQAFIPKTKIKSEGGQEGTGGEVL
jgi:hypothetical protein